MTFNSQTVLKFILRKRQMFSNSSHSRYALRQNTRCFWIASPFPAPLDGLLFSAAHDYMSDFKTLSRYPMGQAISDNTM
jgi:hypothetical protein